MLAGAGCGRTMLCPTWGKWLLPHVPSYPQALQEKVAFDPALFTKADSCDCVAGY